MLEPTEIVHDEADAADTSLWELLRPLSARAHNKRQVPITSSSPTSTRGQRQRSRAIIYDAAFDAEIISMAYAGCSASEMGRRLGVSHHTIRKRMQHLYVYQDWQDARAK